jgi:hypothetical protein
MIARGRVLGERCDTGVRRRGVEAYREGRRAGPHIQGLVGGTVAAATFNALAPLSRGTARALDS